MDNKLKMLDLFSGIGGFSLAASWTGEIETVAFCEIEPFCQKVLKKHWPNVPIYEDIKELNFNEFNYADIISSGFPCQDVSCTGFQEGITGKRSGLWSETCRAISDIRPRWTVVENVANLLIGDGGNWFARVLSDLAALGYDAIWHCIPAAYVGAPHLRDRVWIIAYPNERDIQHLELSRKISEGLRQTRIRCKDILAVELCVGKMAPEKWRPTRSTINPRPLLVRKDDGFSDGLYRLGACGNSITTYIAYVIFSTLVELERVGNVSA